MSETNGPARSTVQFPAGPGVPFRAGSDPRRNAGGRVRQEVVDFREAMAVHLPTAIKVMGELLQDPEPSVRLAAAIETMNRTIGKPKPVDNDTEENVHAELSRIFAKLRERFTPEVYAELLKALSERHA